MVTLAVPPLLINDWGSSRAPCLYLQSSQKLRIRILSSNNDRIMASKTLYVLYNADGTFMGKLRYGYRKLSSTGQTPACAACDITHGGLSLNESPQWVEAKKQIEEQQIKVVQWHRDEIDSKMRAFVQETNLRYPAVVLDDGSGNLDTVMDGADLNACEGKPEAFLSKLMQKNVVSESKPVLPSL